MNKDRPVLYYDGACGLCSRVVRALVAVDSRGIFTITALQSPQGAEMLRREGMSVEEFDSMIVEAEGRVYTKSDAVLKTFSQLGGFWKCAGVFKWIPKRVRDFLYMVVSRNRLAIFGTSDTCSLPSEKLRSRLGERGGKN